MAGPHPSPWTRLLLAALLSISFPGAMGESDTPLQHPSWRSLNFQGTALITAQRVGRGSHSESYPDPHSTIQQTATTCFKGCGAVILSCVAQTLREVEGDLV